MDPADIPGVVALQRLCFPEPFPEDSLWRPEHLSAHVAKFPEGQFVAVAEGAVVASASMSRISDAQWQAHLSWEETLGGFSFDTFDPAGSTLYAADISVHPQWRGRGLARELYRLRFEACRKLGCARLGTACRIPDFRGFDGTHEEYARRVIAGELSDRTLTPLLRLGMVFQAILPDYMDDPESGDAAALLEWTP